MVRGGGLVISFSPRQNWFCCSFSRRLLGFLVLLIAVKIISTFVMTVVANFNPCNAFSCFSLPLPNPIVLIFLCVYSTPVSFFTDWLCPRMRHRVVNKPSTPTGPRAWILDVDTPTSAPYPNLKPSLNRVEQFANTHAESTLCKNCSAVNGLIVRMQSVCEDPFVWM